MTKRATAPPSVNTNAVARKAIAAIFEAIPELAHLAQLPALIKDVEAIKARPMVRPRGPWIKGELYVKGSIVVHDGGLWLSHAEATRNRPPGSEGSGWRVFLPKP